LNSAMTTGQIAQSIRTHLEAGVVKHIDFYQLTESQKEILMGAGYVIKNKDEVTTVILGE